MSIHKLGELFERHIMIETESLISSAHLVPDGFIVGDCILEL